MSTFDAAQHPRQSTGQFTEKANSTPAGNLTVAEPISEETLDQAYRQYVETALWSSSDIDEDGQGEPLDQDYGIDDISDELCEQMRADLHDFLTSNRETIDRIIDSRDDYDMTNVAHDFWLTRNHHGAGFWDRGFGKDGLALTDAAQAHGGVDLYVGDDGKLYS